MIGAHERTQPGYRDNLTPWQQDALFELWGRFFRLCQSPAGSADESTDSNARPQAPKTRSTWAASMPASNSSSISPSTAPSRSASREHLTNNGHPRLSSSNLAAANAAREAAAAASSSSSTGVASSTTPTQHTVSASGSHIPKDDQAKAHVQGQHEAKEMRNFLHKYGGQRLRKVFWQMVKGEHPDVIMLRLLRARKWNVDRAVAVLGSTAAWRVENDVEAIVNGGELELTSTRGGMNILRNGISYMYGASAAGEPVYIIEVGRHFSASQTQDELRRGVILLQETLQSLMPPPCERKIVIFNMNEFGIRNMDWWCVFFMVKTMECFYVETLARVYVHGAPWIFKPIWSILKPLLDPVVRDKIRLTDQPEELAEFVPLDRLPKDSMKGQMQWAFDYPMPDPHENDLQKDTKMRDKLQEDYFSICFDLERETRAIVRALAKTSYKRRGSYKSSNQESSDDGGSVVGGAEYDEPPELASLKARRDVLATKLRVAWLKLRPYMVGKTMVDRWNVRQPDGVLVWSYPKMDGSVEKQVLGEATSLPALEKNLAAIEEGAAAAASTPPIVDGASSSLDAQLASQMRPTSPPSASVAGIMDGSSAPHRVQSGNSGASSRLRGQNGNKKSERRSSGNVAPPGMAPMPSPPQEHLAKMSLARADGASPSGSSPGGSGARPSTSGSSGPESALSHGTADTGFHSMSTIHASAGVEGQDADSVAVNGSKRASAMGGATNSAGSTDTPPSSVLDGGEAAADHLKMTDDRHEAEVPVHPLERSVDGL
ncbi:hypothetical protein BDZ90DRAFT_278276 [Jaminaea rosea]|uniref:CRAL-TRIO domain-containing protein n=1 Tax=Jaminaea rosea TaxID=1569628 RepID=A0A316V0A5_9BASI|nr:hypothetical protein BDZ90DRAFT_278276 [Jaminaea rosea]PWN28865.1 hypothetical protein BDZ90DRAFT_278276 [Jaminaea rosea]